MIILKKIVLNLSLLIILFLLFSTSCKAADYYFDSTNGSDSNNNGVSSDSPWQTLNKMNSTVYNPGDTIYLKKGSTWTGSGLYGTSALTVKSSGLSGSPIIFSTYGNGSRPTFTNPGDSTRMTHGIFLNADWIILEGVLIQNVQDAGIRILSGADNNIIRDIETNNVGQGVLIGGQYNHVTKSYFHDSHMIKNTPGGNDDYGARGILISNSNNEISYNRMINCIAPSYDYVTDGGVVEFWGQGSDNYIHHNWGENSDGFVELGSGTNGVFNNNKIAYNVSVNNGGFAYFHLDGTFAAQVSNFKVENNTIVETPEPGPNGELQYTIFGFSSAPSLNTFLLRNNIFYAKNYWFIVDAKRKGWTFTHENNLYYKTSTAPHNLQPDYSSLGPGEKIADPLFVNLAGNDFHLQPNSPAINAALNLGYTADFEDVFVPQGSAADIGAYEYVSGGITPTVTPTPPFIHCNPLGDLDCSGKVNILDLSALLTAFGSTTNKQADLDNSGKVNMIDLSILLQNFGK